MAKEFGSRARDRYIPDRFTIKGAFYAATAVMIDSSDRIDGWKAIAAYIGKSVRTAQQWSVARGLPIRKTGGGVIALKSEIDAWLSGSELPEVQEVPSLEVPTPPLAKPATRVRLRWLAASAGPIVLLATAASFWVTHRLGPPVSFRVQGSILRTLDANGRVVWEHSFPGISQVDYPDEPPRDDWSGQRGLFTDLDGDGKRELLFAYYPSSDSDHASTLFCFRDDGAVLWSTKLGHTLTTESGLSIYPAYRTHGLVVLQHPRPDGGRIVVASHHSYQSTEHVAIIDAHGRVCSEYWHPGWFDKMVVGNFGDREVIALGGVNNGFRDIGFGPTLVLLDPDSVNGQASEPEGDLSHRLLGIPQAHEAAVVLFPDLVRDRQQHPFAFNYVGDIELTAAYLHVGVTGLEHVHYQFDEHLNLGGFAADEATEQWLAKGLLPERQTTIKNAVMGIKILRNRFAGVTVTASKER